MTGSSSTLEEGLSGSRKAALQAASRTEALPSDGSAGCLNATAGLHHSLESSQRTQAPSSRLAGGCSRAYSEWARLSEGCYLLRTNIGDWTPEDLWTAYIQLTEAEAAFRIHKQDLKLRPIWHQREDRVQAHIMVCFLAYVLWKCLGQMCKRAGLG